MTAANDPLEVARGMLEPGESLVWADRPAEQALARTKLPQVIRGVLGLAVIAGLHWYGYVPRWQESGQNLLLFAFLAAAALYCILLIVAPNLAKITARSMVYAVTDRRLMILGFWPFRSARFFALDELDTPRALATEAGQGNVVFIERKLPWWKRSAGGSYQIEGFYGVADAQRVVDEIEKLRAPPSAADLPEDD